MNPGRELDAMIGKKIFGFSQDPKDKNLWFDPQNPNSYFPLPMYTKNIVAAWSVAEKLRSMKIEITIVYGPHGAQVTTYGKFEPFNSDSASHAICLAALNSLL